MYGSIVGPSDEERTFAESAAPYVAEFVGTFFLVFTIALNTVVITSSAANGVMLMVLVYVFGPISGGHLNPAVSMACGLVGRMPWPQVIAYCLLQVSAGLLAGMACYEVFQVPMGVAPIAPFGFWDAAFLEALYTGMLCFVVLNVAVSRNNPSHDQNHFLGLAVGLVLIAGHAAGHVSGAVLNPAAAIGLEIVGTQSRVVAPAPWGLAYAGMEIFGGLVAAACYLVARRHERHEAQDQPHFSSRWFCEFYGTTLLCVTVGLGTQPNAGTPWVAGAALASIVYAVHDISGAHVNPAVTLAMVLSGKCPLGRGLAYWAAQLLAGIVAGLIVAGYFSIAGSGQISLQPKGDFSWISVFAVEAAFTCILALVVLSVTPSAQNLFFGLAIGAGLTLGGFAAGPISGLLNPAVVWSLATAGTIQSSDPQVFHGLALCLFQLSGGVLASSLFLSKEKRPFKARSMD
ncbi:unnamed protein product [Effrenium voratum]|nr:unnamed protein product [Effrenium voratum]